MTGGVGTAFVSRTPEFTSNLSVIRVAQSLDFCVVFCRPLFVFLSFFFRPLYCLSIFELQSLVTPLLVSANFFLYIHVKSQNAKFVREIDSI